MNGWEIAGSAVAAVLAGIILFGTKPALRFLGRAVAHELVDTLGASLASIRKKEIDDALAPIKAELLVGPEQWPNGSTTLPEAMTSIYHKVSVQGDHIRDIQQTLEVIDRERRVGE